MIDIKKFTKKDVLIRAYNDLLQQATNNEMEIALFEEELKVHKDNEEQIEKINITKGALEGQLLKQERALAWLEKELNNLEPKRLTKGTK